MKLLKLPDNSENRIKVLSIFIGLGIIIFFNILYFSGILTTLNNVDLDLKFTVRNRIFALFPDVRSDYLPITKDIMIVDIDDKTVEYENTYPDDPYYYLDLIDHFGVDKYNALAVVFSLDYSKKFPRKITPDSLRIIDDVLNKIEITFNGSIEDRNTLKLELNKIKEELSGLKNKKIPKSISEKIKNIIKRPDAKKLRGFLNEIERFSESNIDFGMLSPDRESLLQNEMNKAKNVYFTYDAENMVKTQVDYKSLVSTRQSLKELVRILERPVKNRPEHPEDKEIFDAYYNFTPDELEKLKNNEVYSLSKEIKQIIEVERKDKLKKFMRFRRQNRNLAVDVPDEVKDSYVKLRSVQPVHSSIGSATVGQGIRKAELSKDGVLRKIAPVVIYNNKLYPHIDLLLSLKYLSVDPKKVIYKKNKIILKNIINPVSKEMKDIEIPLEDDGTILINWTGLWADNTVPFIRRNLMTILKEFNSIKLYEEYQEILSLPEEKRNYILSEFDPVDLAAMKSITKEDIELYKNELESVKGKIVIIGRTATGTEDMHPTPLEPRYHTVGLHGNVINTIIEYALINNVSHSIVALLLFPFCALIGLIAGLIHRKTVIQTVLISSVTVISFIIVLFLVLTIFFIVYFINIPLLSAILIVIFTFLSVFIYRFLTEERAKRKLQKLFGSYVSKDLIQSLMEDPDKLKLGGEWDYCTVFFSDVAGFTSISESMSPENLVELLNEYLTAMTNIIFKYQGTLDKYIGDAIIALYGAPVPFKNNDHAIKACYATIEMQNKLIEMRKKWKEHGQVLLTARCGVHTGKIIVGNMGSTKKFNYTGMGDNFDFGEHMESGGKKWGTISTISEITYKEAKNYIIARWLDVDWLDDKPIKVYELIEKKETGISENMELGINIFEDSVKLYFQRKWDDAIEKFKKVYNYIPLDEPTLKAIERCEKAKKEEPGEEFDKRAAYALKSG